MEADIQTHFDNYSRRDFFGTNSNAEQTNTRGNMTEIVDVTPATDQDVVYDPESKTATHIESGIKVVFLYDEPPMERQSQFMLVTKEGNETKFSASTDASEAKLKKLYPNKNLGELQKARRELNEYNFTIYIYQDFELFDDVFLKTFHKLVSKKIYFNYISSTLHKLIPGSGEIGRYNTWRCEG